MSVVGKRAEELAAMTDDRFRAVVWIRPCLEKTVLADAEMKNAGYEHFATRQLDIHGLSLCIRIFERPAPTLREAGDAVASLLSRATQTGHWDSQAVNAVLVDWRDAAEREQN